MNRKKGLLLGVLLVALAVLGVSQLVVGKEKEIISAEEMKKILESRYAGEVGLITLVENGSQDLYSSTLQGSNGVYQIGTDAYSGQILHIIPLKVDRAQETQLEEPTQPEQPPRAQANQSTGISLDQARAIALQQVEGRFESIEVEEVNGALAYEVELETPDNQEVKVQVDAYTGSVLSVLWED